MLAKAVEAQPVGFNTFFLLIGRFTFIDFAKEYVMVFGTQRIAFIVHRTRGSGTRLTRRVGGRLGGSHLLS